MGLVGPVGLGWAKLDLLGLVGPSWTCWAWFGLVGPVDHGRRRPRGLEPASVIMNTWAAQELVLATLGLEFAQMCAESAVS